MKETFLKSRHEALGAKMVDFAGYFMPVYYSSIKEEHLAVRNHAGIFDVSHMGEFHLKGVGALDLIQKICSNDASKLAVGQAQYSCFPNGEGGIVDDLLVYRMPEEDGIPVYMLVVNAGNIEKDWNWVNQHNKRAVTIVDLSDNMSLLAVQGPKAKGILQRLTETPLNDIPFYHFTKGDVGKSENVIISNTGYTGSGGFEIYCSNSQVDELWDEILEAGASDGLIPTGLGARDTLRLEMGYCLYGNDITDKTSPIEAGLSWITKTYKKTLIDRSLYKVQKNKGVDRKLAGFKVHDRRVPRQGYEIKNTEGNVIGVVTSGTLAPSLEIPIGMAYIDIAYLDEGTKILVDTGRKTLEAEVCKLPFYKN